MHVFLCLEALLYGYTYNLGLFEPGGNLGIPCFTFTCKIIL